MKITKVETPTKITINTKADSNRPQVYQWWKAKSKDERASQLVTTATFLRDNQNARQRQAAIFARLYGNQNLFSFAGASIAKIDNTSGLAADRPTFNLVQSAIDTLVARIGQSRPQPTFLTDGGDYRNRTLAKKLNNFIAGEFYATKAYEKATIMLRDALVEGTGCLKVYSLDDKVALDRVLLTELFVDPNESIYGEPRQLYQIKLIDRKVLEAAFPDARRKIENAEQAYVDSSSQSTQTVSDLVLVVEGWKLPSSKHSTDGRHTIATSSGMILDEEWNKDRFPFVFLHYSPRLLGFWAQGLAEQLMGTQMEINSLLFTISKAIKLIGVPRIFLEEGSKVVPGHLNNEIGSIIKYQGTKPSYEVAQAVPQEIYAQLQRLIEYGYQQSGVSALDAAAQKPAGLNSGEAIRSYDDISTDRFNTLSRRYDNCFIDLAHLIIDTAKDIAQEEGTYKTIYPGKNGLKQIDLPKLEDENPFIIQCFNMSSLPRDPAGRLAKITEMIQAGMLSIKEGRRLLDYPDLTQVEELKNAPQERIYQILDDIIEEGNYTPPDPFTDLESAKEAVVQYINLYGQANLEEEKMELLRTFYAQVTDMQQQALEASMPQQPMPMPGMPQEAAAAPIGVPQAPPVSDLMPIAS